jgi:rhodanese-related sulfurtransferase
MMLISKTRTFKCNVRFWLFILIPFLTMGMVSAALADSHVPEKKQTRLMLYLNAAQAWERWNANPETIHIIDVRTPAEYLFVGHAHMAVNIPIKFFNANYNTAAMKPVMPNNENFIAEVKKRFKKTDTILVMCRSGGRSAMAVNLMAEAGFQKVYNIIDGFEGDKLNDPGSYHNGKRILNGWKNSGAPWTYKLEREKVYAP